jgi:GNAT superfamily N-acetyltransferase
MRIFSIFCLAAFAAAPIQGRVVSKAVPLRPAATLAPVAAPQAAVAASFGAFAAPALAGSLPELRVPETVLAPSGLPVAGVVRAAAKAVRATPAAKGKPSAMAVLERGAERVEKSRRGGAPARELRGLFDGSNAPPGPAAAAAVAAAPSGLAVPSGLNSADAAAPAAPALGRLAGSAYARVGRRPLLGRVKAFLYKTWNEFQRIRRGKPKVLIDEAREADLERLVEITEKVRLASQKDKSEGELSDTGFLAWSYDVDYFRHYVEHEDAKVWVGRDENGVVNGFALIYGRGVMDPADPAQEYNAIARRAVERRYGPDEEFMIVKQMAVDPAVARTGTGRQLANHMIARLLEHGIDLIATTIVNDDPLRGTRYDIPEAKLVRNNASGGFAEAMGGTRVGHGFLYEKEIERFKRDRAEATMGIHAFDFWGLSLNRRKSFPVLTIPGANLAPGLRAD